MEKEKSEIEKILSERMDSIKNQNLSKAISFFASDVISFDVLEPIQNIGVETVKLRLKDWFSSMTKINDFKITQERIQATSDLAYCSSLNHIDGLKPDGTKNDMWWRETTCYKKTNGTWKITHIHASSPFSLETGKAVIEIKPN